MTEIIDAHHHIWPQVDLPWLNGRMQPRIFGPYESIRRDYLLDEFKRDIAGSGVEKSVYVQANWAAERSEQEVIWVQREAQAHGTIQGIVAYADLCVDDVRPQLDVLSKYPLMRGIRQQLHWHQTPAYRFASDKDLCLDPVLQRNAERLAEYGWCFDLQVFPSQMAGAAELVAACPDTVFVLQHAGMLEDQTESGWLQWRSAMQQLAVQPNVVSKLSAFGTFIHKNDPQFIAQMVAETVAIFGAKRCLFGSNFPIEKIWTDYPSLVGAFVKATESLGEVSQQQILYETAARVYRL